MKKLMLLIGLCVCTLSCEKQKTGFVDTDKVVQEFKEMAAAQEKYGKMNNEMMQNLEGRAQAYQIKLDLYQKNVGSMSNAERAKKEEELITERQALQQEQQNRSRKLQQESQVAIDSIITKVKDKVKAYGKENGYDYIYGQNEAGSIMYGKEENDLTEEIIAMLNGGTAEKKPVAQENKMDNAADDTTQVEE